MRFILFIALSSIIGMTNAQKEISMKLNAGIITDKIQETKAFYTEVLNFGVTFENEFYLLLHTPNRSAEISFLLPNHPTQNPMFHKAFAGHGMYLTIEVENVDKIYQEMKRKNVPIMMKRKVSGQSLRK